VISSRYMKILQKNRTKELNRKKHRTASPTCSN
jgi:hypothetical protein